MVLHEPSPKRQKIGCGVGSFLHAKTTNIVNGSAFYFQAPEFLELDVADVVHQNLPSTEA